MSAPTKTPPDRSAQPKRSAQPTRSNSRNQQRTRTEPRPRSAAATKAYARRAQRTEHSEKLLHRPAQQRAAAAARAKRPSGLGQRAKRGGAQASTASFVVLLIGLLVVGVAATLWLSTQATTDSYKLENLKDTTTRLAQQRGQLKAGVDEANSATSLADRAKQLGMVPAKDPAHLVVGSGGKLRVIGHPKAAKGSKSEVAAQRQAKSDKAAERRDAKAKHTHRAGGRHAGGPAHGDRHGSGERSGQAGQR